MGAVCSTASASYVYDPSCSRLTPAANDRKVLCGKYAGSFGCFIQLSTDSAKYLKRIPGLQVHNHVNVPLEQQQILNLLDVISTKCYIKLLKGAQAEETAYEFQRECDSFTVMRQLLNDQLSNWTTYYTLDGSSAFKVTLPKGYTISLSTENAHSETALQTLYIILFNKCDVLQQNNICDPKLTLYECVWNLVKDLYPVLNLLHTKNLTHSDIKPDNIVKCSDRYKLIDYGMLTSTLIQQLAGTADYMLPYLLHVNNNQNFQSSYSNEDIYKDSLNETKFFLKELYKRHRPRFERHMTMRGENLDEIILDWVYSVPKEGTNDYQLKHFIKQVLFKKQDEYAVAVTIMEMFSLPKNLYNKLLSFDHLFFENKSIAQLESEMFPSAPPARLPRAGGRQPMKIKILGKTYKIYRCIKVNGVFTTF
jgi:serine/threonine protein kinase